MKQLSHQLKLHPPPPQTVCNWTLKCRHANQLLIHLKLTGRPDYGGSFLLQTPYRHHLYGNTCRNMKELPGSISQSIVCQLCQQTQGKSESLNRSFRIQTDKHAGHIEQISIAHLWLRSTRCHFLGEFKIFGHYNLQYETEKHIFTHEKKKGGGPGWITFMIKVSFFQTANDAAAAGHRHA